MENKKQSFNAKFNYWLLDHVVCKYIFEYFVAVAVSTISAFLFCFTINVFVKPSNIISTGGLEIATGGASGFSQDITLLLSLIFGAEKVSKLDLYSVFYLLINVPLLIMAFFKIGKRFSVLTFLNVLTASLFIRFFNADNFKFVADTAEFVNENGGMLARAIFGAVFVGLSSALPYKLDFSAGGVDVLVSLISVKKGTTSGKYTIIINSAAIIIFCLLYSIGNNGNLAHAISPAFYSILYLFVAGLVIDAIHIRNKKVEFKIITDRADLSDILLSRIPHGATISKGLGAYSGKEKTIITMVISSNEVNSIIKIIKEVDPSAFVEILEIHKVLGSFHMRPIK